MSAKPRGNVRTLEHFNGIVQGIDKLLFLRTEKKCFREVFVGVVKVC